MNNTELNTIKNEILRRQNTAYYQFLKTLHKQGYITYNEIDIINSCFNNKSPAHKCSRHLRGFSHCYLEKIQSNERYGKICYLKNDNKKLHLTLSWRIILDYTFNNTD